jgi:hypothetical protein
MLKRSLICLKYKHGKLDTTNGIKTADRISIGGFVFPFSDA